MVNFSGRKVVKNRLNIVILQQKSAGQHQKFFLGRPVYLCTQHNQNNKKPHDLLSVKYILNKTGKKALSSHITGKERAFFHFI